MSYISKSSNLEDNNIIWPGFVDVLASTLMVIIFVVLLFTVSQVYLGDLVIGKNEQIQKLEQTIDIQDETIVYQDESITTKETIIEDRENLIGLLDTELLLLDQEIIEKQSLIAKKEGIISDRDKLINEMDQVIEEKNILLSKKDLTIEEKEILISERDQALDIKENLIAERDLLISEQKIDIEKLNEIIEKISNELSLSLTENQKMNETLIKLQAEQDNLLETFAKSELSNLELKESIESSQSKISSLLNTLDESEQLNTVLGNQISSIRLENEIITEQLLQSDNRSQMTQSELDKALLKISSLSDDIKILTDEIKTLNNILEAKEAEIATSKLELGEIGDRLNRVLTSEIFKLQKYRSEFFGKLREVIGDRSEIKVQGDRFIFQSEILFNSGSAEIQLQGRESLKSVASIILGLIDEIPKELNWILQVDGHTDKIPIFTTQFPSNWELSHARALEVVKFFISQGIPPKRLSANGYGDNHPISLGDTSEDLKNNRRIELKITER
ncbi:MAG: hypothetical protein CMI90_06110 [Pelagibacteraceae bacterium]|nr:hypothetical protein [Pelagibacteraceae bacterium]